MEHHRSSNPVRADGFARAPSAMPMRILGTVLALALGGCFQTIRPSDSHLKQEVPPPPSAATIPAPVQVTAALPKPKPTVKAETYSVVVNNVRVQELLFALARDANMNIDVHPGIAGSVTLNAIDQTLPQLLSRIGRQVDMRWELDGPNLTVMPDSPYLRVYKIDYVNMERSTIGTVSVASQIGTAGSQPGGTGGISGGTSTTGGGAGGGNSSTLIVRNTSSNKFWATLIDNIQDILRETDKIFPGAGNAQQTQQQQQSAPGAPPGANAGAPNGPNNQPQQSAPAIQFREAASVIANPEAGVITVRATSRQHEKLQEFLDQVLVNVKRQVLIEGTIVEVRLNNQYQQGVDWAAIGRGLPSGFRFFQGTTQPNVGTVTAAPTGSFITGTYNSNTLNGAVRLLETFGTVRVLSSPRISVINNQTAILKVIDNIVYFTITVNTTANQNTIRDQVVTTPNTVAVGFVMNVTPQISSNNTVLLNLKPTISRVNGYVQDPNPALNNTIGNRIPQVQTREMESVMRVTDGQIAVMGGLIQDAVNNNEDAVPGLARVPILGNAFENKALNNERTELVIFLRPVVIKDPSLEGDYRAYRVLLPDDDFLTRPNPGRRPITSVNDAKEQLNR